MDESHWIAILMFAMSSQVRRSRPQHFHFENEIEACLNRQVQNRIVDTSD